MSRSCPGAKQAPGTASPLRFSEDIAHFLKRFTGAMMGLGAGSRHPGLHQSHYDFPDALIASGVCVFAAILDHWLGEGADIQQEGNPP